MNTVKTQSNRGADADDLLAVSPGFKRTDVGMIPEDWKVKTISDVANVKTGPFGSSLHERDYVEDGTPIITVEHLGEFGILHENLPLVSDLDKSRLKSYWLRHDDVVFSRVGSVDRNSLVRDAEEGWLFSGRLLRVRIIGSSVHSPYLSYHFSSEAFKQRVRSVAVGQTMASLNTKILKALTVVLPPLPEQRAIANALSDVDGLIKALDKLIAKKRAIKLATMQRLLTGKARLPGFSGEWKETTLGEVVSYCSSGATPYRGHPEFFKGNIRWITSGELKYQRITDTKEKISIEAVRRTNLRVLPPGTFLMAITGLEAEGTRGSCGIVGADSTTNQSCMAIFPKKELSADYLFHWYVLRGKTLALQYCQGTKQQSYTAKTVKKLPILLPVDPQEQRAISTLLFDMDAEIAALERRREKTKAIKQGMMQALLTGRVRLVDREVKA